jgi:hypothetical protein
VRTVDEHVNLEMSMLVKLQLMVYKKHENYGNREDKIIKQTAFCGK